MWIADGAGNEFGGGGREKHFGTADGRRVRLQRHPLFPALVQHKVHGRLEDPCHFLIALSVSISHMAKETRKTMPLQPAYDAVIPR